jgi:UDP-GlcNAc3NAcA epimerase
MKLLTIVGARPQFIKAAAVGYAIQSAQEDGSTVQSVLVHTGQHYDAQMSDVFFAELGLQRPDHDLSIGSASHGAQTGRMLEAIERVLISEAPDVAIIYGDTNSTLAGAVAAVKLHIPVAHVEAGLRSYNRRMPEEINRVVADHLSRWLFCPGETAAVNLEREGIERGVHIVGDVMYELAIRFGSDGELPVGWHDKGLAPGKYILATIHRAENTDDPVRLSGILSALEQLAFDTPVVLPLHPRTQKLLVSTGRRILDCVRVVAPLSYRQMIAAEGNAALIITDSGGVQKEAFWLGIPCVTARDETEWTETREDDRNIIAGADSVQLTTASRRQLARGRLTLPPVARGNAGAEILNVLLHHESTTNKTS